MSFDPKVYRDNRSGVGMPADDPATDHTSDWTSVSLLKGLYNILANTGITIDPGTLATAAKQDTGNTSLASIDTKMSDLKTYTDGLETLVTALNGYVDGVEALIGTTNSTLTTLGGYVDGLEALVGTTNTALTTLQGYVDTLEAKGTGPTTGTQSSVNDTASDTTILASNASRKGAAIFNDSTALLYLLVGSGTSSATAHTVQIPAGGYYELPPCQGGVYTGVLKGIWASDASGAARVTEWT